MDDGGKWRPTYDRPIRRCWSSAYDKQNCLASRSPPNPGILNFSDQEVQGSAPIHRVVPPEANKVSVSFERNDERDAVSEPLAVECVFLMDSLYCHFPSALGPLQIDIRSRSRRTNGDRLYVWGAPHDHPLANLGRFLVQDRAIHGQMRTRSQNLYDNPLSFSNNVPIHQRYLRNTQLLRTCLSNLEVRVVSCVFADPLHS